VLARHLPELDWHALWADLDPRWSPPPEVDAWTPPRFTLLTGGGDVDVDADQPHLTVVAAPRASTNRGMFGHTS
jgi:hypothetical protein